MLPYVGMTRIQRSSSESYENTVRGWWSEIKQAEEKNSVRKNDESMMSRINNEADSTTVVIWAPTVVVERKKENRGIPCVC